MTTQEYVVKIQGMTTKANLAKMTADNKEKLIDSIKDTLTKRVNAENKKAIQEVLETLEASLKPVKKDKAPVAPQKAEKPAPVEKKAPVAVAPVKKEIIKKAPVEAKKAPKKEAFKHDHDLKVNDTISFKEKVKSGTETQEFKVLLVDSESNMIVFINKATFGDVSVLTAEKDGNYYLLTDLKTTWQAVARKL